MPSSLDEVDRRVQTYNYSYDKFGRILSGFNSEGYSESLIKQGMTGASAYDLNGNIQYMRRFDQGDAAANFLYYYEGNKLSEIRVQNEVTDFNYPYDRNGNMTGLGWGIKYRVTLTRYINQVFRYMRREA